MARRVSTPRSSLSIGATFVALAIVRSRGMASLSLVRAHGRVLLSRCHRAWPGGGRNRVRGRGRMPELGLEPGTVAPSFSTADTTGRPSRSSDSRTGPTAAPFSSRVHPAGPARRSCPRSPPGRPTRRPPHDRDRERRRPGSEHGGGARVSPRARLSDHDLAVPTAYDANGTPSAVLIAPDGTIASHVAA